MLEVTTFEKIKEAQKRLEGVIVKTLCEHSRSASAYVGTGVHLKFENQQRTGSFKIRGAYNKLSHLTQKELSEGVSACSAGNHAQGVAYSAQLLGAQSHIVMPVTAPLAKVEATRGYGAQIYQSGHIVDEARDYCYDLSQKQGYHFVHPYEDPDVIAGQGTIGLELYDQIKNLDSVIVSVGGGGLISGVALALKSLNPKIKVYGAVAEASPGMYQLFHSQGQKSIDYKSFPTIADGIAIKKPSSYIFENYIQRYVDDMICVSDEEIAHAMVFLLERSKAVVEGAGAAGLAAAKKAHSQKGSARWDLGGNTAVVLCGGNIDLNLVSTIIEKGLSTAGRMARIKVAVEDFPGSLHKLTSVLAEMDANVIDVVHDRISPYLALRETLIEFLLATKNTHHIKEIKNKFRSVGVKVLQD